MITDLIGMRRFIILAVLAAVNAIFLASYFMGIAPAKEAQQRDLRRLNGEVSRLRSNINGIKNDFQNLDEQKAKFKALQDRGFFEADNIYNAREIVKVLNKEYGVRSVVDLQGINTLPVSDVKNVKWQLKTRRISLQVNALDDVDLYNFTRGLQDDSLGLLNIRQFSVQRSLGYNKDTLREILQGRFPAMFKADVVFDWYFLQSPSEGGQ